MHPEQVVTGGGVGGRGVGEDPPDELAQLRDRTEQRPAYALVLGEAGKRQPGIGA